MNNRAMHSFIAEDSRDLEVGDLSSVGLVKDTPRGEWPMERVVQVFPGPNGYVLTVDVRVKGSVLQRPIVKLCPLECVL